MMIVVDGLRKFFVGGIVHVKEWKKDLVKVLQKHTRLGVRLYSKKRGVMVMNWDESSLVYEMKEKQYQDPLFLKLKSNVHNKKVMGFEQGGDDLMKYQGRLCV